MLHHLRDQRRIDAYEILAEFFIRLIQEVQRQQREILRVCQPGECEESLDEKAKELLPKLAARLGSEGYEPVSSVGWPEGRDEVEVGALQAKLHQDKGRLSLVREKKSTPLRALGGRSPRGEITAVYPVLSAKLIGLLAGEFFVFKLP